MEHFFFTCNGVKKFGKGATSEKSLKNYESN